MSREVSDVVVSGWGCLLHCSSLSFHRRTRHRKPGARDAGPSDPEKTENLDQSAPATRSLTGQALSITLIHRQPNEPCYGR